MHTISEPSGNDGTDYDQIWMHILVTRHLSGILVIIENSGQCAASCSRLGSGMCPEIDYTEFGLWRNPFGAAYMPEYPEFHREPVFAIRKRRMGTVLGSLCNE